MDAIGETRDIGTAVRQARILAALGLVAALVGGARPTLAANLLGPTRPSQVVTVMATGYAGQNGHCTGQQLRVNGIINGNGSVTPFAIPEGKVFVLTGGTWSTSWPDANVNAALQLSIRSPTVNAVVVSSPSVRTDSAGYASGSFSIAPGMVIKPGVSLCALVVANEEEFWAFPRLSGFLAKDK